MKPVVLITTTDPAASRFRYLRFSAGTRRSPPQLTHVVTGPAARHGGARPVMPPPIVEAFRKGEF